jgi:hypothetical protein
VVLAHWGDRTPWDHASVFQALAQRFPDLVVQTNDYHFVGIFSPQSPQCAVLYAPNAKFSDWPLNLHPGKDSWSASEYRKILPAIDEMKLAFRKDRRAADMWIRCKVDWVQLAACLGL